MQTPDRRAAGGGRPEVHAVPHHRALLADAGCAAVGPQPPPGRRWGTSPRPPRRRRATARTRPNSTTPLPRSCGRTATTRPSSASATRCPSGSPARPVRSTTGRPFCGLRALLRLHRRRDEPVDPALVDGVDRHRAARRPAGYHLMPRPRRQGHRVHPPAEEPHPGQAVLHLLRARRDAHPAPRAAGVDRRSTAASSTRAGTRLREETFARQKELGVDPGRRRPDRPRPEGIAAWDDVADASKPILARQMEVYAGFLEYADHHTGRVIDALEDLGILDDTARLCTSSATTAPRPRAASTAPS